MVHVKASVRAAATHAEAMRLIEAEKLRRQVKTDRLRTARLAQAAKSESPEKVPKKKAKPRGPDLTGA
jgi:hypothetical protein